MADNQGTPQKQPVFVLDIGTRSVIGIAGHADGVLFHVDAAAFAEHPKRAMIDGQIEDIHQVAKVAGEVKQRMEKELGQPFSHVGVAAAGRALKTQRAEGSLALSPGQAITAKTVFELEMAAVDAARAALNEGPDDVPYYCVGHSVVGYTLDGYPFSTILDHHGRLAEAQVIATFLPAEVVASLRRCMDLLGLSIDTLTLEPIAAMRAIVPEDVRLLNLALVDIGAGTSDIALTRDGAVAGYTMATVAGDEVTEAIVRHCLVDFETAERIKFALGADGTVPYRDVLGFEHTLPTEGILAAIAPAIDLLAQVVADKILECNGGVPAAVFLVGGGSKTPGIAALLAEKLGLDETKIALGGTRFSGQVLNEGAGLDGPEYATPVGIALITQENTDAEGASVTINGSRVRLFTTAATSVMDALLIAGYRYSDLMGRNGRSLTFTLNGQAKTVRGGHYTVAEIKRNGEVTTLQARVLGGDEIEIVPAISGKDATAAIEDFAEGLSPFTVSLNEQKVGAGLVARKNGRAAQPKDAIEAQDEVEIQLLRTVQDLCKAAGFEDEGLAVTVNGTAAEPSYTLQPKDMVLVRNSAGDAPAVPPALLAQKTADTPSPADTAAPQGATPPATVAPLHAATADDAKKEKDNGGVLPLAPSAKSVPASPKRSAAPAHAGTQGTPSKTSDATGGRTSTERARTVAPANNPTGTAATTPAKAAPPADKSKNTANGPAKVASAPRAAAANKPGSTAPSMPAPAPTATPAAAGGSLRIDLNGKTVVLPPKADGQPHLLYDMLELVDIDPSKPQGAIVVQVNGVDASYLEALTSGDRVDIHWNSD